MTRIGEMSTLFRRPANPFREQFRREYAEVRQQYAETAILAALLMHVVVSSLLLFQVLVLVNLGGLGLITYQRFWYWVWSSGGFMALIVARFPRLHNL
eukprot:5562820-Heterocapsa_arctica.AAC.1